MTGSTRVEHVVDLPDTPEFRDLVMAQPHERIGGKRNGYRFPEPAAHVLHAAAGQAMTVEVDILQQQQVAVVLRNVDEDRR